MKTILIAAPTSNSAARAFRRVASHLHASAAFSLIEVTLALAVGVIGLVAILGLLPNGLDSSRQAVDRTLSATLAQDTLDSMRSQPFTNVTVAPLSPIDLGSSSSFVIYYDQSGLTASTLPSYFKVSVDYTSQMAGNLSVVTASVLWPAMTTNSPPANTNVFVTQIARER